MKKMFFALVAMVVMTMSANAQSVNNNVRTLDFGRLSSYLELRINQVEPVKTAMAQFNTMMEMFYEQQDDLKAGEAWEKIVARHKATMQKVLTEKQYDKYVETFDLTVKNATERIKEQRQLVSK